MRWWWWWWWWWSLAIKSAVVKYTAVTVTEQFCKKQVIMSRTWLLITSSDDLKLCRISHPMTQTVAIMCPASLLVINPINSNTTGVGNTCIKTSLQWCRCPVMPSANWVRVMIYDPARWTADTRRRCCFRTQHALNVIWTRSNIATDTQTCYLQTDFTLPAELF